MRVNETSVPSSEVDPIAIIGQFVAEAKVAALSNRIFHSVTWFGGSSTAGSLLACVVAGPDAMVEELKLEIEQTILAVHERHHMVAEADPPIQ